MFFNWPIGPPQDSVNLLVQVFDQKMETLWARKYTLGYANRNFLVYGCLMRNDGSAFILGNLFSQIYCCYPGAGKKHRTDHFIDVGQNFFGSTLIQLELGEYSLANLATP